MSASGRYTLIKNLRESIMKTLGILIGIVVCIIAPVTVGMYVVSYGMPTKVEHRATVAADSFISVNGIEDLRTSCSGSMLDGYTRCLLSKDGQRPILLKCPTGFYLNKVQRFTKCEEQVFTTVREVSSAH